MAWLALIWFFVGAYHAFRYLYGSRQGQAEQDRRSVVAGEVGLVCTLLATFTGMVFAWKQWGTPWNWDPKQVGISVLILVYLAYFGLRMSIEDPQTRGRLSAVYAIIAAFSSPFLTYVLPNLPQVAQLHPPGQTITGGLDSKWRIIYTLSFFTLLGTTLWIYELRLRFENIAVAWEKLGLAAAITAGYRTEAIRKPARDSGGE
jgi:heme exporter protein C